MDLAVRHAVAERLAEASGHEVEIAAVTPVGGGSINDAFRVELASSPRRGSGRRFVKCHHGGPAAMFEREAEGLAALAAAGGDSPAPLRVPGDPLPGAVDGTAFLVLEWIETGRPGPGFFERFGRAFARLHRLSAEAGGHGGRFGFCHDNWLGSTPQPNGWLGDWVEFWRERRLGHQLRLARANGLSDRALDRLGDRLSARLREWIDLPDEPPCLLHGDLWGGNYLAGERGEPVLIDPACSYGHREADLAMTRLFGGFTPAFYAAYQEEWPLPPGSEPRLEIYELYHLLNHLNLFGRSYRGRCLAILERLVG